MSSLSRYSTRAIMSSGGGGRGAAGSSSIAQDSSVPVAVASALFAAGITWALKPSRYRNNHDTLIPKELIGAPYSKELELAVEVALQAGHNIAVHTESRGTEEEDHPRSISDGIEVDEENERLVVDAIRYFYPHHKIIGGESSPDTDLTLAPTWIIDGVAGTTNFAAGLPLTCVSIGLCVEGKAVMGVVYAPMTNELYVGIRDHGSFRNGARITGTKQVKRLSESVVNFEFGTTREDAASCVRNIMKNGVHTTRCLGSGVLDFCYVATGRLDVVFAGPSYEIWRPWDFCAAYVICKEAGCAMESLTDQSPGEEFKLYGSSIVCATTQELWDETRRVALGE